MKRIAIDMDETIADALGKHIRLYNEAFGASLSKADFRHCGLSEMVPDEHARAVEDMVFTDGFFEDLEVMPDAPEVIRELTGKYEVFITSSAMEVPSSFAAKFTWLERHFPFIAPSHLGILRR